MENKNRMHISERTFLLPIFKSPAIYKLSEAVYISLKAQLCELKKHWSMIACMLQRYPENFAIQLFMILQ